VTGTAAPPADLSIIIVSTNEARWLEPCLRTVFDHAGDAQLDVLVVDNNSTDGTRELVKTQFPAARVVQSENHGFAHANNRGAMTSNARYVLFLNPVTDIVAGDCGHPVAGWD
jgi:GT2 family glycosyltransferase